MDKLQKVIIKKDNYPEIVSIQSMVYTNVFSTNFIQLHVCFSNLYKSERFEIFIEIKKIA